MSTKRDSRRKPKKDKRPTLEKETLKDLDAERDGANVQGGAAPKEGCPSGTYSCRH